MKICDWCGATLHGWRRWVPWCWTCSTCTSAAASMSGPPCLPFARLDPRVRSWVLTDESFRPTVGDPTERTS